MTVYYQHIRALIDLSGLTRSPTEGACGTSR